MRAPLRFLIVAVTMACAAVPPVAAQDNRTEALAQELVALLEQRTLNAAAARLSENEFAAVLYIPGIQILAVSAEYTAPALINEKISNGNYRDAYLDLASASVPATKVFIEDVGANGLRPDRRGSDPFDVYTKGTGAAVPFNGDYESRGMDESAYRQAFSDAEGAYVRILEALLLELKQPS